MPVRRHVTLTCGLDVVGPLSCVKDALWAEILVKPSSGLSRDAWMTKGDSGNIMINQCLRCMKVIFSKEYWPNKTWNYEHSENSFCVCFPCDGDFHGGNCFKSRLWICSCYRNGLLEGTILEVRTFGRNKISMNFAHKRHRATAI